MRTSTRIGSVPILALAALLLSGPSALGQQQQPTVSFARHVQPILADRCAGCHRPGKAKGGLDLTTFAGLARGGDSGPAFVAGRPGESEIVAQISGDDPAMPETGKPLAPAEVARIRAWIAAGAPDDSAENAPAAAPPKRYASAPPVAALAYSPDGSLLAVAGYHEVLLHAVDARGVPTGIIARLLGKSPKIQSLTFSADGSILAVAGGNPAVAGEVQIWDVASRQLRHRYDMSHDTLFGISLAPDNRSLAVGCADKTVRVLRVADGRETLRFRSHAEWVLGTLFTRDGKRLVSAGRDKAMKIIDLADGRFVDDINSPIDPILGLVRHPQHDRVLYAGGAGTCRIYRISDNQKRTSARNDTNLLRVLEKQAGPVHAVAFSADGARCVAAGADPVARIHDSESGEVVARIRGHQGPVFAAGFHRSGAVATAGFDGQLRIFGPGSGALLRTLAPVPMVRKTVSTRPAIPGFLTSLTLEPKALTMADGRDERRVLVHGTTRDGQRVDLTGKAVLTTTSAHVDIGEEGYLRPRHAGTTTVLVRAAGLTAVLPVTVRSAEQPAIHFARHVMPVLGRSGCNAGTCHGAQAGKNGFMLSLRGFDLKGDHRALVEDLSGRRFDRVHPERSLMLLKPTAAVPHEGQKVIDVGSRHYETLRRWIAEGTGFHDDDAGKVVRLEVLPARIDLATAGQSQTVLVTAHYADGTTADVTRDAMLSVSDTEVSAVTDDRVESKRRGECSLLVRFEGRYAVAPITVMGDRTGFVWRPTPQHNFIDRLVDSKLERLKVLPAELCTDAEFVRRLHLDLTGKPPTPDAAQRFVADPRPTRKKREELIDRLIGNPDFVAHWANKWADLLQCSSKTLGAKGVWVFREWIAQSIARNQPYDAFVRELLTASGSTFATPPANYMRALSDKGRSPNTTKMTEDITQTFLGVRFNCCKCHNHPFEKWTQDQYYQLTAHFAQVRYKRGPNDEEMVVYDSYAGGETEHPRTASQVAPRVPFGTSKDADSRRARLAAWLTAKDNALFARSYVNRVWSYFFGLGIIEPVDDIRAGNPPSNPQLLDALEKRFLDSGFDFQDLVRTICRSHTWQRSFRTSRWNRDDRRNFSHALPRRLSAEQLLDAVAIASGKPLEIAGLPAGSRPVDAPDGQVKGNDFLQLFGRPKRESACECARTSNLSLAHALNLVGGRTLHDAIHGKHGRIDRLIDGGADDRALVSELYWASLCRAPRAAELEEFARLGSGPARRQAAQDLLWALTNSPAFLFNR